MRISRKRWLALTSAAAIIASTTVFAAVNAYADPGGTLTGHVLDNGVPVPDVSVQIFAGGSVFVPPTTTDASGAFTLANVPPAAYRVNYRLPGGNTFYANSTTNLRTPT